VSKTIELYADGGGGIKSCHYYGGAASILMYGDHKKMFQSGHIETTNNRMELQACINGLGLIKSNKIPINIYSDSGYVANAFIQGYYKNWTKFDLWRKSDGSEIENVDLWKVLIPLHERLNPNWHHVKGHANTWGNCMCDHLATEARKRVQETGLEFPLTERLPDDHIHWNLEFTKTGRIKKR
jgi:ribonuclease HI